MVNIQDNPLYYAAIGGIIIGIATSINYSFRGSVTGMSGMLYSTVTMDKHQMPKNIAIIGGMLIAGGIFFDVFQYGTFNKFTPFGPASQITISTSQLGFALAGILVGFGTKLSNGCTSGHGLCGLARLSIRSLVAVLTFLIAGIAIATIIYHAGGLGPFTQSRYSPQISYDHLITSNICIALGILLPFIGLYIRIHNDNQAMGDLKAISGATSSSSNQQNKSSTQNSYLIKDQLIIFLTGLIFGAGLLVAGMVRRSNIIGFLALGKDWNPSLMFVLGSGLLINLIFFTYMIKVKKQPFFGQKLFNPNNTVIDARLVGGAICFGLGWGIGGLCPGPSIMQTPIFTVDVHLIWFPFFFLGQFIANKLNQVFPTQNSSVNKTPQKVPDVKQTPNMIIEDSEIIVKGDLKSKHSKKQSDLFSTGKDERIAQILHEHGPGYTHAHHLPTLNHVPSSKNIQYKNDERIIRSNINQREATTKSDINYEIEPNLHTMISKPNQMDRKGNESPRQRNSQLVIQHIN